MNITMTWNLFEQVKKKATGYWEVMDPKTGRVGRSLAFENGELVYARSWYEGERLESAFVTLKILTPEDITAVLEKRVRIQDLVTADDLRRALEEVAVKVIGNVLKFAQKGDKPARFDPVPIPPGSRIGLDTKNVLLRGLMAASVGNMTLALNGEIEQIVTADFEAIEHSGLVIPADLQPLLGMFDGTRSLMATVQDSGKSRARIGALIYILREFGYLDLRMPSLAGTLLEDFELDYERQGPPVERGILEDELVVGAPQVDAKTAIEAALQAGPVTPPIPETPPVPVVSEPEAQAKLEVVLFKDSADVAKAYQIKDDTQETQALVGEIMELRYLPQTIGIDDLDPRLAAFVEAMRALQPKPFPLAKLMVGMGILLAVFAAGIVWFVSDRIPNLRGGRRPRISPVGEVKLDRQSRVGALVSLDLQMALAQGTAYLNQLQREDPDQWSIRLGIAVQSRQIHPLLGIIGDWTREDVFLVPIELEGQKDCYQIFFGTFKDEAAAREVMKRFEDRAREAKMTVAPFNVLRVPRSA